MNRYTNWIEINNMFCLGNETDPNDTLNTSDDKSPPGKRKVNTLAHYFVYLVVRLQLLLETFYYLVFLCH